MKKTTTKAKKAVVKTTKEYKATLKVFGKTYNSTGSTVSEAIQNIHPEIYRSKSVLTIQHGEATQDRILPASFTMRLFGPGSALTKEVTLKQISARFAV